MELSLGPRQYRSGRSDCPSRSAHGRTSGPRISPSRSLISRQHITLSSGDQPLAKFMAVPHYTYMMMKLPGPNGIISLRGDVRRSHNCDPESCTLAENIQAKVERDSIQHVAAALQEEGDIPAKKAAKSGINANQDVKKIMLNPTDPTKS